MSYNEAMKVLVEEYEFKGLQIKLYEEDLNHALENHPGEVSLDSIRNCIENPDTVIASLQGKNACLFYEKKVENDYFVVVVHTTGLATGEVRTAYRATYIKKGKTLFAKERT